MKTRIMLMHRYALSWVYAVSMILTALVAPAARAELVGDWSLTAAATIAPMGTPAGGTPAERNPIYAVDLATVHIAIFDAVNAIEHEYRPYAYRHHGRVRGASADAAINEAAYQVLLALYPSRFGLYLSAYDARMAAIGDPVAKVKGQTIGAAAAAAIVALRANDGREPPVSYVWSGIPGVFVPNPAAPLVGTNNGLIRPFALRSGDQFRPGPPPSLTSELYARDFNEVKEIGSAGSLTRTPLQTEIARFHTEPPPLFWPRNLARFASNNREPIENARLFALLWMAQADAGTACFDAKYTYKFWRPRSAIPRAGEDGNPATSADSAWLPVVPTPNHPEYPAAHGCATGSVMEVLREFFGTSNLQFSFDSNAVGPTPVVHNFQSTDDLIQEVQNARVYGGMHYRNSAEVGTEMGTKVGRWVSRRLLRERDDDDDNGHDHDGDQDRD